MLHENTIVHGMWVGAELSKLELLSIKSFLSQGHQFWLWTYSDIQTPLPEGTERKDARRILPEAAVFRYRYGNQFGHGKGSLAGFSDIFRYKLLYEYGGWWTDMDVTCLRPLDFDMPYVFRSHDVFPVVGNLMKCPKGSPLMWDCFEQATDLVTSDNMDWLLPIRILNEQIQQQGLSIYIRDISNADRWEIVHFYATFPAKPPASYYVLHWMNEEWRAKGLDKNSCIRYSLLDQLMTHHDMDTVRRLPPNKWQYVWEWSKMKLIPLVPHPIRWVIKTIYYAIRRAFLGILRVGVLPLIPKSWKHKIKRWWYGSSIANSAMVETESKTY